MGFISLLPVPSSRRLSAWHGAWRGERRSCCAILLAILLLKERSGDLCFVQQSISEICSIEESVSQTGASQIGLHQFCASQIGKGQVSPGQISAGQVGTAEIDLAEVHPAGWLVQPAPSANLPC